jgi:hypothetical protein
LWYNEIPDAIGYAKFRSRSCNAVIRVYDAAGNVIETHERKVTLRGIPGAPDENHYSTNIPAAAQNITKIVMPTTTRDSIELGWSGISFLSQAT